MVGRNYKKWVRWRKFFSPFFFTSKETAGKEKVRKSNGLQRQRTGKHRKGIQRKKKAKRRKETQTAKEGVSVKPK